MKRLFLVALVVVSASACVGGNKGSGRNSGLTRQYQQVDTHGDLDRAIGQR